jgi:hypothetical protein
MSSVCRLAEEVSSHSGCDLFGFSEPTYRFVTFPVLLAPDLMGADIFSDAGVPLAGATNDSISVVVWYGRDKVGMKLVTKQPRSIQLVEP